MILDFSEIAVANKKSEKSLSDQFELLTESLLKAEGYSILESVSRGPDGGKDLIVAKNNGMNKPDRHLVSCKHFTAGTAVSSLDESNISDRLERHKCAKFIGVYSTVPTSDLIATLEGLEASKHWFTYSIYNREIIESKLLSGDEAMTAIATRHFPRSYSAYQKIQKEQKVCLTATDLEMLAHLKHSYRPYYCKLQIALVQNNIKLSATGPSLGIVASRLTSNKPILDSLKNVLKDFNISSLPSISYLIAKDLHQYHVALNKSSTEPSIGEIMDKIDHFDLKSFIANKVSNESMSEEEAIKRTCFILGLSPDQEKQILKSSTRIPDLICKVNEIEPTIPVILGLVASKGIDTDLQNNKITGYTEVKTSTIKGITLQKPLIKKNEIPLKKMSIADHALKSLNILFKEGSELGLNFKNAKAKDTQKLIAIMSMFSFLYKEGEGFRTNLFEKKYTKHLPKILMHLAYASEVKYLSVTNILVDATDNARIKPPISQVATLAEGYELWSLLMQEFEEKEAVLAEITNCYTKIKNSLGT